MEWLDACAHALRCNKLDRGRTPARGPHRDPSGDGNEGAVAAAEQRLPFDEQSVVGLLPQSLSVLLVEAGSNLSISIRVLVHRRCFLYLDCIFTGIFSLVILGLDLFVGVGGRRSLDC